MRFIMGACLLVMADCCHKADIKVHGPLTKKIHLAFEACNINLQHLHGRGICRVRCLPKHLARKCMSLTSRIQTPNAARAPVDFVPMYLHCATHPNLTAPA